MNSPTNPSTRYDRQRVASLDPAHAALKEMRLPPLVGRRIGVILNAIEVQIEVAGDDREVNRLLIEAVRTAVSQDALTERAAPLLQALDRFEQAEAIRWQAFFASTLPEPELTIEEQLNEMMQAGYGLLDRGDKVAACRAWLETWDFIKQMTKPRIRSTHQFDDVYLPIVQSVFNWCQDFEIALGEAGDTDAALLTEQARYAREFLQLFPDEDDLLQVNFRRTEAEALWKLGRRVEAEAVFSDLVTRLPDEGWGYIGWSDLYWLDDNSPKDYDKAESILKRALDRPTVTYRDDVLDRLEELQEVRQRPHGRTARGRATPVAGVVPTMPPTLPRSLLYGDPTISPAQPRLVATRTPVTPPVKSGRNDPCPCGSGKKYKRCCGQ